MTTIAGTRFGETFNALAFTGFSYLFRKLDKENYLKESRRHNLAMERLAVAMEKWFRNETEHKDRIQELRRQIADANSDITTKLWETLET